MSYQPPDPETIRLSEAGKAFKTELTWWEHETAAWVEGQGLHGWVDRDSPVYGGSFRCLVKQGPGPLWTWKVEVKVPFGRFRVRGHMMGRPVVERGPQEMLATGKRCCRDAFRRLLVAVQATLPEEP